MNKVNVSLAKAWSQADNLANEYLKFRNLDILAEYNDAMMNLSLEESISGIKFERTEAQKRASFHFKRFKGILENLGYQL